jgi:RHS repeat-associated protein
MGNVSQRMDPSGAIQDYVFDAYGYRTGTDNSTDPYSAFEGQYGYYADSDTGLEQLTHRYYDVGTGRFVTRDPIGYSGGIDLYRYTGNNPIEWVDPSGPAACRSERGL